MKEAIKGYITAMVNSYSYRSEQTLNSEKYISRILKSFVNELTDLLDFVEDVREFNNRDNELLRKRIVELEEACENFAKVEINLHKKIKDMDVRMKELISITELDAIQVAEIIDAKKPKGLFYHFDNFRWIGIDNETGDAWVEEFESKEACIDWLLGGDKHE